MRFHAFYCDEAVTDAAGKLHVHGIHNELRAQGFPARHDLLLLCGILEWDDGETGRYDFRIDVQGPDEVAVFSVEGHTVVNAAQPGRAPARTHLILPMEKVVLPEPGRYRTAVTVAGVALAGPDLYVQRHADD